MGTLGLPDSVLRGKILSWLTLVARADLTMDLTFERTNEMFPVNLVVRIDNEEELKAIKILLDLQHCQDSDSLSTLANLVKKHEFVNTDQTKEARILVAGKQLAMGTLESMKHRFKTECGVSTSASVELQRWSNGGWKNISARRRASTNFG